MSADVAKLVALVESAKGAPIELSVMALRGEGGATVSTLINRWEAPYEAARVVSEALELAQQDATVTRARCTYSFAVMTKPPVFRRLAFAPQADAEPIAGPTEPPTPAGWQAMAMRWLEAEKRAGIGAQLDVLQGFKDLFGMAKDMLERQEGQLRQSTERERAVMDLYASLRAKDHEFQLEMARLGHEGAKSEQILDKIVGPVMPHLAPQLARGVGGWFAARAGAAAPSPASAGAAATPPAASSAPVDVAPQPPAPEPGAPEPHPGGGSPAFRELVLVCVRNDVAPERLADMLAAELPESERDVARAHLLQAVRDVLIASP